MATTRDQKLIELLGRFKVESKKITGFMTDPKGNRTFTVIEFQNSFLSQGFGMKMSVIVDGQLIDLN